jgi:hypothetical protein
MTHGKLETIPVIWSDEHDGAFFALVRNVFGPAFTNGATALLMSYDEDCGACPGPVAPPRPAQRVPARLTPANGS